MKKQYAGIILAEDAWWLSTSRAVYDAWDLPDGYVRDAILSKAVSDGVLHNLGPSSMSSAQAMAAAKRVFGEEVVPDDALRGFKPHTQAGRDFLTGTGEFAPDEEHDA